MFVVVTCACTSYGACAAHALRVLTLRLQRLRADDELMVPMGYYPTPLANGQLLFMRTSHKLVHAYRRATWWREMLASTERWVFDEWWTLPKRASVSAAGGAGHANSSRPVKIPSSSSLVSDSPSASAGLYSMADVYYSMLLAGELRAVPTATLLVQVRCCAASNSMRPTDADTMPRVRVRCLVRPARRLR